MKNKINYIRALSPILIMFTSCAHAQTGGTDSATTTPSTAATKKAAPVGIFCLMEGDRVDRPAKGLEAPKIWSNPDIAGMTLRTFWNKVEPSEGQFDWSHFERGVALAHQHNKSVSLSLAAGPASPDWVYKAGSARYDFDLKTNYGEDKRTAMPPPWDPVFQKKWSATIHAMGKRFDGDPNVAYVTMGGLGWAVETHFVKGKEEVEKFQRSGELEKWVEAGKRMVDIYASAFPTTPFIMAIAEPVPGPSGDKALGEVVEYGVGRYPNRFGVMQHGLNAKSSSDFFPNQLVQKFSDRTPVGFQMVWNTKDNKASLVKGSLKEALERGEALNAHFVEVYAVDCADPANDGDLRKATGVLASNRAKKKSGD